FKFREPDESDVFAKEEVRCPFARDRLLAFITQGSQVDVAQQMFAGTEQHGPDDEMHFVNQAGAQKLPKGRYAAAETDIAAARCCGGLLQSGVNAPGDKAKLRAARHGQRRPWVMREHEHGRVIRRLIAPPAPPAVVRPRASDRTEHVAPNNPGADSDEAKLRHAVIDPRLTTLKTLHLVPQAGVEQPLHQLRTPDTQRVLKILAQPRAVAVDGCREALHAEL